MPVACSQCPADAELHGWGERWSGDKDGSLVLGQVGAAGRDPVEAGFPAGFVLSRSILIGSFIPPGGNGVVFWIGSFFGVELDSKSKQDPFFHGRYFGWQGDGFAGVANTAKTS